MRRRTAAAAALAVLVAGAGSAGAAVRKASAPAVKEPVVAVVDTGLRATHQEFDYRGAASTSDQVVAWWDFTTEVKDKVALPEPGQVWDTAVRDPYDRHGHGTGTAGMAVGRNAVPEKTASALPGGKVAIAKVGNEDGAIEGDLAAAIRWAAETVRADVISMSIGTIVPIPAAAAQDVYDAIAAARARGVLVVVSNGNGWGNLGLLPGDPGWASGYSSPATLSVGAAGAIGLLQSTDPEVAAAFTVLSPAHTADNAYVSQSGTSFAAPYVAGFAARLLREARLAGRTADADRLELLAKYTAKDTAVPPSFEGYGTLGAAELATAIGHVRAGTLPTRPSPDVSGLYVESVAGSLRDTWSG